jgi:GABA permease
VSDTIAETRHARVRALTPVPKRRILIVANHTATSSALISELCIYAKRGPVDFHLVVPALNSHLRHWLSDTDDAVSAARRRAADAQTVLSSHGLPITVEIGDSVPLLAIGDALSQFAADEIVISTPPPNRLHWLEHNLVELARSDFDVPVRHVIASEDVALAA